MNFSATGWLGARAVHSAFPPQRRKYYDLGNLNNYTCLVMAWVASKIGY